MGAFLVSAFYIGGDEEWVGVGRESGVTVRAEGRGGGWALP
jgi:hypothetical protein